MRRATGQLGTGIEVNRLGEGVTSPQQQGRRRLPLRARFNAAGAGPGNVVVLKGLHAVEDTGRRLVDLNQITDAVVETGELQAQTVATHEA